MVFANKKQRMGFFAKLKGLKQEHDRKVAMKIDMQIIDETKELKRAQADLNRRQTLAALKNTKAQAIANQKKQISDLKESARMARKRAFDLTTTGQAVAILKKDVQIGARGVATGVKFVGVRAAIGAKRFATDKNTKRAIRKIRKNIFG